MVKRAGSGMNLLPDLSEKKRRFTKNGHAAKMIESMFASNKIPQGSTVAEVFAMQAPMLTGYNRQTVANFIRECGGVYGVQIGNASKYG